MNIYTNNYNTFLNHSVVRLKIYFKSMANYYYKQINRLCKIRFSYYLFDTIAGILTISLTSVNLMTRLENT